MKIELKSREGSVYKKLCNSVSEANSDTELIVPDSLEDILRILSCRRQCRIREKNVGQDAVSVSGEIDVTVMYIPETGDGVRVVGTTIPFEINFSAPGADSTSSAVTKLLALNADAKAVNPRKILISTSTVMELSCYKYSDVCWFEPPENAPDKLYFKTSELKCKSIVLVSEKTLSVEDELDVPEQLSGGDFVRAFSSIRQAPAKSSAQNLWLRAQPRSKRYTLYPASLKQRDFRCHFLSFSLCRTAAPTPRSLLAT